MMDDLLEIETRDLGGLSVRIAGSVWGFHTIAEATEALRRAALDLGVPASVVRRLPVVETYWEYTDHYKLRFRDKTICWAVPQKRE